MARETWTDDRLDDLKHVVTEGFAGNREEFKAIRAEMRDEFRAVREEIGGVRGEISGLRGEIAAQTRAFQQLTWGLIGVMLAGFLGTIAAIITQL